MSGSGYPSAAVTGGSFVLQDDHSLCSSSAQRGPVSGSKIDRVAVTIVGLERCRCRRIGFVLVAALGIVEQGGNDRQQHDHDDADNDGNPRDQELDDVHVAIMARRTVKNMYLTLAIA